ncbi:DUF2868 domain-containing protein [Burkholderiaceae bacterium FT117]|uniref:DUF2868 domain-containing protein n=1 Tax=Zeimonas sediminis TaxID=2944268 RepID=UPI002342DA5C|nr:DUF2868 domain-containing protein [Zeimonas sediminis]MCM5569593.1 DUF2868 domain-containing protein [Zeimonas sediminis]
MNESDARAALLVRAWETAPAGSLPWSDDDRAWASRTAAQAEGEQAPVDVFVARRARVALQRIAEREPAAGRLARALAWRPWTAWAAAAAALALGVAADAAGASQRINLLAPPLLALLLWNLAVYLAIAARALGAGAGAGPIARVFARAARSGLARLRPRPGAGDASEALARFARDWTAASAALNAARVARALHVAAIAFACGALTGLYLRGLAFEYRAGWESTFLEAGSVAAILGLVLGPASALTGIALPDAAALQAMRFPGPGVVAAPWIHLYAVTTGLVVVLPRLALALRSAVVERRLAADFPIPLDEPYFAALTRSLRGQPTRVLVQPYNLQPSDAARRALQALATRLFGPAARLQMLAPVPYGDEDATGDRLPEGEPPAAAIALLSITATPETETHGRFLAGMAGALAPAVPLIALVDESAFIARFGQDDAATRRLAERRQAWTRMMASGGHALAFVDLERDDPSAIERAAGAALAEAARHRPVAEAGR